MLDVSPMTGVVAMAVLLDLLLGDPVYRLHPVRLIGLLIGWLERLLRRLGLGGRVGGALLLVLVVVAVPCGYLALRLLLGWVLAGSELLLDVYVFYSCLALRDMVRHARPIGAALRAGDVAAARARLQWIVGRDVSVLDAAGVGRAAVESVAEGFVDGFLSPLLWFAAGGIAGHLLGLPASASAVVGALGYRCVNTLDSTVGYRNDRYRHFGTASARFDDVVNFLPARLSLPLLWVAACLLRLDAAGGWRIACRDRLKHASPNSAHTESFVAGALGIRLGGPTVYPHGVVEKPWMGDGVSTVGERHIGLACRMTLVTGVVAALLVMALLEVVA